jgi:succinoglycan biosynthesis protein ExoO
MDRPDVSFAIACYNCADYLEEAVDSALAQVGVSVELLLVDDGSSDATPAIIDRLSRADERVRGFATPVNGGPGAARNVALDHMRGRWFAVFDSDDLLLPDRSARLIDAADRAGADIIADDLVVFGDGMTERRFLGSAWAAADWLPLDRYFANGAILSSGPSPGFLKPMIRHSVLARTGIRYDERLRIAEDDDLIVRLLLAGARYWIEPEPLYRYRKHGQSISHRLSLDHVTRIAAAEQALEPQVRAAGKAGSAYRRRRRALANAVAFTTAIEALKARRPVAALSAIIARPTSLPLFREPLAAAWARLTKR